jgi:hypothetical protein
MSAERGWIGDRQPPTEWHMPGWVKTGGRQFVHSGTLASMAAPSATWYRCSWSGVPARN